MSRTRYITVDIRNQLGICFFQDICLKLILTSFFL